MAEMLGHRLEDGGTLGVPEFTVDPTDLPTDPSSLSHTADFTSPGASLVPSAQPPGGCQGLLGPKPCASYCPMGLSLASATCTGSPERPLEEQGREESLRPRSSHPLPRTTCWRGGGTVRESNQPHGLSTWGPHLKVLRL